MTVHELNKKFRTYFPFSVPLDGLMTMMKGPQHAVIDVIKLDKVLANHDCDYDPDKCTYQGKKNISMGQFIVLKYGQEAYDFVKNNME